MAASWQVISMPATEGDMYQPGQFLEHLGVRDESQEPVIYLVDEVLEGLDKFGNTYRLLPATTTSVDSGTMIHDSYPKYMPKQDVEDQEQFLPCPSPAHYWDDGAAWDSLYEQPTAEYEEGTHTWYRGRPVIVLDTTARSYQLQFTDTGKVNWLWKSDVHNQTQVATVDSFRYDVGEYLEDLESQRDGRTEQQFWVVDGRRAETGKYALLPARAAFAGTVIDATRRVYMPQHRVEDPSLYLPCPQPSLYHETEPWESVHGKHPLLKPYRADAPEDLYNQARELAQQIHTSAGETVSTAPSGAQKGRKQEMYSLIPAFPLAELARVYGDGVQKYAPHNWRAGYPYAWSLDSLFRHIEAFRQGEDTNPESGLHHLAHATFHLFALMEFQRTGKGDDDRADD